jgi:hypothetical protein
LEVQQKSCELLPQPSQSEQLTYHLILYQFQGTTSCIQNSDTFGAYAPKSPAFLTLLQAHGAELIDWIDISQQPRNSSVKAASTPPNDDDSDIIQLAFTQ